MCLLQKKYRTEGSSFIWPITGKNTSTHAFFCKFINSSFPFQPGRNEYVRKKPCFARLSQGSDKLVIPKRPHCFHDGLVHFLDEERLLYVFLSSRRILNRDIRPVVIISLFPVADWLPSRRGRAVIIHYCAKFYYWLCTNFLHPHIL